MPSVACSGCRPGKLLGGQTLTGGHAGSGESGETELLLAGQPWRWRHRCVGRRQLLGGRRDGRGDDDRLGMTEGLGEQAITGRLTARRATKTAGVDGAAGSLEAAAAAADHRLGALLTAHVDSSRAAMARRSRKLSLENAGAASTSSRAARRFSRWVLRASTRSARRESVRTCAYWMRS